MSEKFHLLTADEKKQLSAQLGESLPFGYQDLGFCKVVRTELPFYPGWQFVQIQKNEDLSAIPVSFFYQGTEVEILDWQADTIYRLNQKIPLHLSIADISAYVLFFLSHTRTRDGQMQIISSYEDFKWREEPSTSAKKSLSALIRPPHLVSWDEANRAYELGAHILFGTELFECRLRVNRHGEIQVTDRMLQVEDVPVLESLTGL
ncbi:MAG: hypothetical protein H6855_01105 [Rhodospirillales bacterium]|nr:hypothetical protein [Rhodospirillales bacterium]MCB9964667.1 hypothetical protein [Rhodospirillales bacterium]MCB9979957.1 hypothetical protein [Rhodospirillales bacterium]